MANQMSEFKGKKIAVLGLGASGIALVKLLSQAGAKVDGYGMRDERGIINLEAQLKKTGAKIISALPEKTAFSDYDLIVDSPGGGGYQEAVRYAREKGTKFITDLDLACQYMKGPIIGVTGTNGKSTTVAVLGEMLKQQGYKVLVLGGDFGEWTKAIAQEKKIDYYVLELSSRRLEVSSKFHPHIAVLLNIFPAHGERHGGGLPAYFEAKTKIFAQQTEADFLIHEATAENIRELIRQKAPRSKRIMFSLGTPLDPPCAYGYKEDIVWNGPDGAIETYSVKKSPIKNHTYFLDLIAALAAARLCRVEPKNIQWVIDKFKGLNHRMQKVRTVSGVNYVDDTRSTNVGATVWALSSTQKPILWIAGGAVVPGSFLEEIPKRVKGRVKAVILVGTEKEKLKKYWQGLAPILEAQTIREAVELAHKNVEAGDEVIFSPACPPDLMAPEGNQDRGDEFMKWVKKLPDVPRTPRDRPQFSRI